ncbi:hypothetical protein EP073_00835 [Geovibrio thiophilus]|uniref:Uncharacterized protein n=1 Tax=Geovibrio thiophilus TaxID=139438 RepID=A0A410JUZ1_9BACT|nr:hypothetical protein [Geovibrio thiophilus]QAR31996.1 hypothetical protein EP073_00835 [Geovibrio thiophilus]
MSIRTTVFAAAILFCASAASAYDYPISGGSPENYTPVFEKISSGQCDNMTAELTELAEKEGVSQDFYLALCLFDSGQLAKGYAAAGRLVAAEDFDEAIYLMDREEKKDLYWPDVYKNKGFSYYGTGDLESALKYFLKYKTTKESDPEVDYRITDIYINSGDLEKAEAELEAVRVKDDRYTYRRGILDLKKGNVQTAFRNFRGVSGENTEAYANSSYMIAEMCASQKRFGCSEKAYEAMASSSPNFVRQKKQELEKQKKLFGAVIAIGEQYDTNVTSVDEDKVESFSEEDSFRTYIFADLRLSFYDVLYDRIDTGLLNYKSWNHSVSEYDAQSHKLYAGFIKKYDDFELTLPYVSYALTYMDGEKYSDTITLEAKGAYLMDKWRFYAPVSVTFRDYDTATPADYSRDGTEYKGGLGVSRIFSKIHMASLEGHLGTEDTDGKFREVTTGELKLTYAGQVMKDTTLQLDYNTILYDYKNGGREDRYHSAAATVLYKFLERHYINFGYRFSLNDSNEDINDYKKHVFDMGVSYFY